MSLMGFDMKRILTITTAFATSMIISACAATNSPVEDKGELFVSMSIELGALPQEQLNKLVEKGHIGAMHEYALHFCQGFKPEAKVPCQENMLLAAKAGNPDSMMQIALFMQAEDIPMFDVYESYKWTWIASHFRLNSYSENEERNLYEQLIMRKERMEYAIIKYSEENLTSDEVSNARREADIEVEKFASMLKEHCKTWQDEDYVCFYHLGEQPSYEEFEEEFYELNGF